MRSGSRGDSKLIGKPEEQDNFERYQGSIGDASYDMADHANILKKEEKKQQSNSD